MREPVRDPLLPARRRLGPHLHSFLLSFATLVLAACGGGGGHRPASHAQVTLANCPDLLACTTACDGGNGGSCYAAGAMHETGSGAPQDYTRAAWFYDKACNAGEARGCNDLGVIQEIGLSGSVDVRAAADHYRRACEGGDAEGCANLSIRYDDGSGVPKDPARARALRKQACSLGVSHACRAGE